MARTHGMTKTPIFGTWNNMLNRCKPGHAQAKDYFLRGISVCERWLEFESFYEDMGECPPGMTLDRINNDLGYSPDNCRWASRVEQCNNSRKNHYVEYRGVTKSLAEWSRELGMPYSMIKKRLKRGWDVERAFSQQRMTNQCG